MLHELETGLRHHSLITSQEQLQHYRELLAVVKEEYEDIVKNEVQRAIAEMGLVTLPEAPAGMTNGDLR